eukprot:CAMPEP_0194168892 /NCGR_PEP_ID=MMETSP0154-20130528/3673_1 /TAXON_ID=1049557 /ORGANISM="Thalassiothrix antarctica, Strain L6-D1" /LENGTH=170 /DNA_ID=CAMNT_0038880101 /DNA_START=18 /DNA_END=530 /DNA_ORIENTATION=-
MKLCILSRLLCLSIIVINYANAQPGDNYYDDDDDGWNRRNNYDYNNNNDGGRQQKPKPIPMKNQGGGWIKLILTGVGGYALGAAFHPKKGRSRVGGKAPKLRFKKNTIVDCHMGKDMWIKGTIIEVWTQQGPGLWAPYKIRLEDGTETYSPTDNNNTIRLAKKSNKVKKK